MKVTKFYLLTKLVILSFIICSCVNQSIDYKLVDKFTSGYDSIRQSIGLPLIKEQVRIESMTPDIFSQLKQKIDCVELGAIDKTKLPRLDSKTVYFDKKGICFEENYFINANKDKLKMNYVFKPSLARTKIGFDCEVFCSHKNPETVTKNQADSILRKWNIKL